MSSNAATAAAPAAATLPSSCWRRYRAIFRAAWQARHELAGPKRLADEAAFLPAALSLQDTPVHPAPRRLAFAICRPVLHRAGCGPSSARSTSWPWRRGASW